MPIACPSVRGLATLDLSLFAQVPGPRRLISYLVSQDIKNARGKVDHKEWKRHADTANSVYIWAQENLAADGQCIYYQPQDVKKGQARPRSENLIGKEERAETLGVTLSLEFVDYLAESGPACRPCSAAADFAVSDEAYALRSDGECSELLTPD